jgi:negative regulator of flagellin synthesis FlgM
MKINGYGNVPDLIKSYNDQKKTTGSKSRDSVAVDKGRDTLELSAKAREMKEIKLSMSNINEIRDEKVSQIKKDIENGEYKINARKIADGIVQENLLDRQF